MKQCYMKVYSFQSMKLCSSVDLWLKETSNQKQVEVDLNKIFFILVLFMKFVIA